MKKFELLFEMYFFTYGSRLFLKCLPQIYKYIYIYLYESFSISLVRCFHTRDKKGKLFTKTTF